MEVEQRQTAKQQPNCLTEQTSCSGTGADLFNVPGQQEEQLQQQQSPAGDPGHMNQQMESVLSPTSAVDKPMPKMERSLKEQQIATKSMALAASSSACDLGHLKQQMESLLSLTSDIDQRLRKMERSWEEQQRADKAMARQNQQQHFEAVSCCADALAIGRMTRGCFGCCTEFWVGVACFVAALAFYAYFATS